MPSARLEGKLAVVTGGASGIGLAIARVFLSEGARVLIADRSGQQDAVARELGERAWPCQVDVSNSAQVTAMIETAIEQIGGVDILVNNAGIDGDIRPLSEVSDEDFDKVIAINLRGVFLGMRAAIPAMIRRRWRQHHQHRLGGRHHRGSRLDAVRREQGRRHRPDTRGLVGIRQRRHPRQCNLSRHDPDPAQPRILQRITRRMQRACSHSHHWGRLGQPQEVASMALYLASSESAYVTGASLTIDGGYTVL